MSKFDGLKAARTARLMVSRFGAKESLMRLSAAMERARGATTLRRLERITAHTAMWLQ